MLKIKIVHKGLILVAVPLIFGIVFISFLAYGLSESNRFVQRELKLKDAKISYIMATQSTAVTNLCAMSYIYTNDEFFDRHFSSRKKQAAESFKHLKKIVKSEPSLSLPSLQAGSRRLTTGSTLTNKDSFLLDVERLSDQQAKEAHKEMDWLQTVLFGGILLGIFVSIALAMFFRLNITNRLLIIVNNAISLAKRTSLTPPFKGDDEIAELGQFLFKSATEIRELERFKKEMIGVVSHELKSPLSSVGGFLSSLSAGVFGELNAKAKEKTDRTYSSVKRLMSLVADLLYLDRLELEMCPEENSVDELIAISVDSVKELSEKSGIEIIINNQISRVFADRNRLVQVIVNLLSNAMKFSPENGTVTIETSEKDGCFHCRVIDQGCGIPAPLRAQIFEPFKQVDAKDARSKKGTGLGLTISRSIVEQHGGTIGVDSEEGKGSSFWFQIPRSPKQVAVLDGQDKSLSLKPVSGKAVTGDGKFNVLQQGLVIISVPLIFQLVFVSVIGCMLSQVRDQTRREENSMAILDSLNRMADVWISASYFGMFYVYTKNETMLKPFEAGKLRSLRLLDHAAELSASDPEKTKDIKETRLALEKMSAMISNEASKGKQKAGFEKLVELSGMGGMLGKVKKLTKSVDGVSPDTMLGSMHSPSFIQNLMRDKSSMSHVSNMMRAMSGLASGAKGISDIESVGGMGSMGALGALSMLGQIQEFSKDGVQVKIVRSFLEGGDAMDRLMARERAVGEKLAAQRLSMIKTLNQTLFAGILLNILLSVFLAVFLMRKLTSRLKHVMENTARMVKREPLLPPKKGGDEIAYLDQTLYESANHLVELETFKRELISIVSHELRTPLLSISSALEILGEGVLGELSEKGTNRLKFAQEEANRLIRLINDLLDIEKMEAGKFVLDISELKVDEPVKASMAAVAQLAELKQIKLESAVYEADATLRADRDRLCQVLINLLSNAIKFSPQNGTIKITVEKSGDDEEQMKFCVTDQGRGIPEELSRKIFDRFVQVEKSDETVRGGSGLGLAISRAIVEQHGGTIGVESNLGAGSRFWFNLPKRH